MDFVLRPWQFYLVILAGWINRQQEELINYSRTENQVLKETYGKKRISTTTTKNATIRGSIIRSSSRETKLVAPKAMLRAENGWVAYCGTTIEKLRDRRPPSTLPTKPPTAVRADQEKRYRTASIHPRCCGLIG